jgi:DNA-binding response OmpR family regulator
MDPMYKNPFEDQARPIAEYFIRTHYPEELPLFDPLWEQISISHLSEPHSSPWWHTLLKMLPMGLPLDRHKFRSPSSALVIATIKEVIRLLEGAIIEATPNLVEETSYDAARQFKGSHQDSQEIARYVRDYVHPLFVNSLRTLCASTNEGLQSAEKQNINQEESPSCVAWFADSGQLYPRRECRPCRELKDQVICSMARYDIVILHRTVHVKYGGALHILKLEEREYRLLLLFLKHRGHYLPTIPLYRKAWSFAGGLSGDDEKSIVQTYLKVAISRLREKMGSLSHKDFEIPRKGHNCGYQCLGVCSFALVLSADNDAYYTLVS